MRKNKRKHYSKFRMLKWYSWPEFNVLNSAVYSPRYDYRYIK